MTCRETACDQQEKGLDRSLPGHSRTWGVGFDSPGRLKEGQFNGSSGRLDRTRCRHYRHNPHLEATCFPALSVLAALECSASTGVSCGDITGLREAVNRCHRHPGRDEGQVGAQPAPKSDNGWRAAYPAVRPRHRGGPGGARGPGSRRPSQPEWGCCSRSETGRCATRTT
jgi:hypothetical protein